MQMTEQPLTFAPVDIHTLSNWCKHRGLRWAPGSSGEPSMLLERQTASRPWQRMVLCHERDALRLLDETGTVLAEASTLPALLDAVDGGVAEPSPVMAPSRVMAVAAACAALAVNVVL